MGVKFIVTDDATGAVTMESTDWDAVSVALDNEKRTDRAQKLIYRARQSADSVEKAKRVLDGRTAEHAKIMGKLAENLPAGKAVSFDDNGVPVALVDAETPASEDSTDAVSV